MRLLESDGKPAARRHLFKAAVLSAGLATIPSCAEAHSYIPLPAEAPAYAGGDSGTAVPAKHSCLDKPERKVVEVALPGGAKARYATVTTEVEVGDYAIPPEAVARDGVLKVVRVTHESVGLSFLASRDSVWLLQYGQASTLEGPSGKVRAIAELCVENKAKLTITYQTGHM